MRYNKYTQDRTNTHKSTTNTHKKYNKYTWDTTNTHEIEQIHIKVQQIHIRSTTNTHKKYNKYTWDTTNTHEIEQIHIRVQQIHILYCTNVSSTYIFSGAFPKLWKWLTGLSVLPDGTGRLPLGGFSRNLVFDNFSKTCTENPSLIKIWQKWEVLYMKAYVTYDHISLDYS